MEAWKEELYHWGVKGMKWRKHKAMSDAESAARNAEWAARNADEMRAQLNSKGGRATNKQRKALEAADNRAFNAGVRSAMKNPIDLKKFSPNPHGSGVVGKNVERAKKKTRQRVRRENRRIKARSFLKSLFGGNIVSTHSYVNGEEVKRKR